MEITNSLIQKFFANQCDAQEFEAVMQFFELHPEVAAKEMGLDDWEATEPGSLAVDKHEAEVLEQLRSRLFPKTGALGRFDVVPLGRGDVADQLGRPGAALRMRRLSWSAVAASLLLAVGGWMLIHKNKTQAPVVVAKSPALPPVQAAWKYRTNSTARTENIVLPDGSRVKLYAHSSLRYTDSFGLSRRDSWLEGGAEFFVKKDKAHAFTVYTSTLATTALGTTFGVKGGSSSEAVKLYSGRVVVRSVGAPNGWSKDIYLLPGQQVTYDNRRMLATVSKFEINTSDGAMKQGAVGELVFNNSSLKEVFRQLTIQYHKKFTFRASDLAGLNFTGTVPRTDSLDVFLRLLAGMNNLDISEQPAGYIISRREE